MKKYLKLARVKHYIKNVFILLPLFFGQKLFDINSLVKCVFAFFAFGFISSVVYIINDINDADNDAKHPTKRLRPIASGAVSKKNAIVFAVVLGILSLICVIFACRENPFSAFFIGVYFVINLLYSYGLKNYPIVDVTILASGFLLRLLFGAGIVNITVSSWLYLTVLTLSFYLGLGKRRNELLKQSDETRKVLKYYNYEFLDKTMYMFMAIAIVFYSLWCVDPITSARIASNKIIWSVPIVIIILLRYSYIVEGDSDGDPAEVLLHDKPLLALGLLYFLFITSLIYII